MEPTINSTEETRTLSEEEIDFLESQIPAQAVAATQAAFWDALTRGEKVLVAEGNQLIEISPDGSKRFIENLAPNVTLPIGKEIIVK
ncbi:hypothetical protein EON80_08485 [bacterium]|nr:MAG: hypothetical protein EON80_08485 [bacterium]